MLGAIIGDIVGSVYEFDNYKSKDFQPLIHPTAFVTDDTVCTIAVADILVHDRAPAAALKDWCRRFWHVGGWGARFGQWVQDESLDPYGSFGNGAAMRVSPAGLLATSAEEAIALSNRVTEITHDHPEGLKGAAATALAIFLARHGTLPSGIRDAITRRFGYDLRASVDAIRPGYLYNETCQETVPQALTCALEAVDFEDALRNAVSIGGDSDTLAAIAGGVAEARFGIPAPIAAEAKGMLPEAFQAVLDALYAAERLPKHRHP
jgi:ADP-ribosyl-[dinitrogen reductase] hydrolase